MTVPFRQTQSAFPLAPGRPGPRALLGALLFAAVLLIACCQPARAAVVEADDVQRQVDTPTGVRIQTGIQEPQAVAPAEENPAPGARTPGPGGGGPEGLQPGASGGVTGVDGPGSAGGTEEASNPATSSSRGGGGLLGPLVVGLLVVVVGVFLVARGRGESA